ncbi:hypothetical protein Nepgr_020393 [Nepenthes gracilis]|uniref:Uncharacterized protein n=1 Tax=Nepenthes gracilis TaxID=150966 RepID=A0AAD3XV13_NEPGR|nr:hypothetical protein Nepgr_020393 [Nepenthes gracilis]
MRLQNTSVGQHSPANGNDHDEERNHADWSATPTKDEASVQNQKGRTHSNWQALGIEHHRMQERDTSVIATTSQFRTAQLLRRRAESYKTDGPTK